MVQSPFPGMDPYLEAPGLWPDVHESLMYIFREQLTPLLAPKYVTELSTQIVIDEVTGDNGSGNGSGVVQSRSVLPDVTVTRSASPGTPTQEEIAIVPAPLRLTLPMPMPTRLITIYIRQRESMRLVTVIELLSPVNKRYGDGRQDYLKKRNSFLQSSVHLIEIDLLREGPRMPFGQTVPTTDYLAIVSAAQERPECAAWPISVRERLPVLPVPLLPPDPVVPLDMGQALRTAYQRARYDLRIDYRVPAQPPLPPDDAAWAATLLPEQ